MRETGSRARARRGGGESTPSKTAEEEGEGKGERGVGRKACRRLARCRAKTSVSPTTVAATSARYQGHDDNQPTQSTLGGLQ